MVAPPKNQQARLSFVTVSLLCWYFYFHADTKTNKLEIPQNDHNRMCQIHDAQRKINTVQSFNTKRELLMLKTCRSKIQLCLQ